MHRSFFEDSMTSDLKNRANVWKAAHQKKLQTEQQHMEQIESNIQQNINNNKPPCKVQTLENYTTVKFKVMTYARTINEIQVVTDNMESIVNKDASHDTLNSLGYLRAMTMLDSTGFGLEQIKSILSKAPQAAPVADHPSLIAYGKCDPTEEDVIHTTEELEEKLGIKSVLKAILMSSEDYKSKIILLESIKQQQAQLNQTQNLPSNPNIPPYQPPPADQQPPPQNPGYAPPPQPPAEEKIESQEDLEDMKPLKPGQNTGYKSPYKLKGFKPKK